MLREVLWVTNNVRNSVDKYQALAIHDIEPLWEDGFRGREGSLLTLRPALS